VSAYTDQLWAFSQINAAVAIVNGAGVGGLSDGIEFETPEGRELLL